MVGGTDRFCTELSENLEKQVIGKTGAEGVYGITFHAKKLGAAIKTDDGKMGPQYFIAYDLVKKHTQCTPPHSSEVCFSASYKLERENHRIHSKNLKKRD